MLPVADRSLGLPPTPPRIARTGRVPGPVKGIPQARSSFMDLILWMLDGATRRSRTGDLLITNQPLYQLS